MEICDLQDHTTCYYYDKKEEPQVEIVKIGSMEKGERSFFYNEFIFMLEGSMIITLRDNPGGELHKGELAFMPTGDQMQYQAMEKSKLLILRLFDSIHLCHGTSLEQLHYRMNEMEKPEKLMPLKVNARLKHFAQGVIDIWDDGLRCRKYLRAETSKLLTMLPAYYSKEDLCFFFYPILSPNTAFAEYVWKNWLKHRTVSELARGINLSSQQFSRRFCNVFKQKPLEWLRKEKARLIYEDIQRSEKPLKEIATDYGFTNQANFNRFCKVFYKMTPGEMRKKK